MVCLYTCASSTNAKKWEQDMQTLRSNNQRLTTALQESNVNVEEWKKQLAAYKEENSRMKTKVCAAHLHVNGYVRFLTLYIVLFVALGLVCLWLVQLVKVFAANFFSFLYPTNVQNNPSYSNC